MSSEGRESVHVGRRVQVIRSWGGRMEWGYFGLIRPHWYLLSACACSCYYTVRINVWWEAGAIGVTDPLAAKKISGLEVFG